MDKPKVIFLDAVGTLFGVKGSVGDIYSQIAREFRVDAAPESLNTAFYNAFQTSPPPVFPGVPENDIPQYEFAWWRAIAKTTFTDAGVISKFEDFDSFFTELYIHFGTGEPWEVYPDVVPALINWRRKGIDLGVISNFDSRIYSVLQELELREFFGSITISTQVGAAKPDAKIFTTALEKHNCEPSAAWHVGDSKVDDYQGAKAVGMRGVWVNRKRKKD